MSSTKPPRKVLIVCHSNLSLGAKEVIDFLIEDAKNYPSIELHFVATEKNQPIGNHNIAYLYQGKGLISRFAFEFFSLKRLIDDSDYDYVLSLQNFVVRKYSTRTGVLLHQGLIVSNYPFPSYEWKLRIKTWLLKYIFKLNIANVDDVYVQLPWMKRQVIKRYNINESQVDVIRTHKPSFNSDLSEEPNTSTRFLYPAAPFHYKNHQVILDALMQLPSDLLKEIHVDFTFDSNSNNYAQKLALLVRQHQLPIKFIGTIPHEQLMVKYTYSTLIYSSMIESLGFPLIEARGTQSSIFVIDLPYARESLQDYGRTYYFSNATELATLMKAYLMNAEIPPDSIKSINPKQSLLENVSERLG